jgi:hypothetical protein
MQTGAHYVDLLSSIFLVLVFAFCKLSKLGGLTGYAKHNANFVLVVSGSLEAERTKKLIEIVYDLFD